MELLTLKFFTIHGITSFLDEPSSLTSYKKQMPFIGDDTWLCKPSVSLSKQKYMFDELPS
jgi:hypothetical protein